MSQVVFRETHICPVGEHCPSDIVQDLGAMRRCGRCPLACKSIDHLPAITAKQRMLLERIRATRNDSDRLEAMGTETSELGELYDAMEADFQEYIGWKLAEEILEDMRLTLGKDTDRLHVEQPEIIRQHLTRVVGSCSNQEFVLRRVIESNNYPSLATDRLRLQVSKLKKIFLARVSGAEALYTDHDDLDNEEDEIAGFARMVSMMMEAKSMNLEQLAQAISRPLPERQSDKILIS